MELEEQLKNEPVENTVSNDSSVKAQWTAPTEEEYNTALKSASNKAKTDILKELGVKSVKEFQDLLATVESEKGSYEDLKTKSEEKLKNLEVELSKAREEIALTKLGIPDEYKKDMLELARNSTSDEKDLETALKEVVERYKPLLSSSMGTPRFGVEKTPAPTPDYKSDAERYLENRKY